MGSHPCAALGAYRGTDACAARGAVLPGHTELDSHGQEIDGLGPLNYEVRRGMYLHPTFAVTPDREPLGVLDALMWARAKRGADGARPGLIESKRWVEGYQRVAEMAADMPDTRLAYVADREADIMEMMLCTGDLGTPPTGWCGPNITATCPTKTVPSCGRRRALARRWVKSPSPSARVKIRKRRTVRQQLWASAVKIKDGKKGRITVTCVAAREVGAPVGVKPIEWRLLTNRVVTTQEHAVELIDWYRACWEIEIYFHVLKNDYEVEALQLSRNADVDCRDMMAPHWKKTQHRMRAHRVVLCLQDTTELDFNRQEAEGLGR